MEDKITLQISDAITASLTREEWIRVRSRINNAMRVNKRGAPRQDGPRCPCGDNPLHRAKLRAFECCRQNRINPAAIQQAREA